MTAVHETNTRRLSRPRDNRWIAGVCSGLARRFGLRPNLVRLLFVLSCLLPGPQFIIYLMLWAIIPSAPNAPNAPKVSI
jgi:phage shock protein PspC (stress-responsive transcriptional regulator)